MLKRLLHIILPVLILSSCMDFADRDESDQSVVIRGIVTDMEGKALEHIRITATSDMAGKITCYSSSDGKFQCSLPADRRKGNMTINISIEDIDNEDNGGLFESSSDTITIFEKDFSSLPIMIDLNTYHLNHATVSGYNLPS